MCWNISSSDKGRFETHIVNQEPQIFSRAVSLWAVSLVRVQGKFAQAGSCLQARGQKTLCFLFKILNEMRSTSFMHAYIYLHSHSRLFHY